MTLATAPSEAADSGGVATAVFGEEASAVLRRLQRTMRQLIDSIPHPRASGGEVLRIRRAAELQRALGVHAKLAWQVHRIAHGSNPLLEVVNIPGPAAMGRLLAAAEARGVNGHTLGEVREALEAFDRLIAVHAGSRSVLDSMILGLAERGGAAPGDGQLDLAHRRAAFKANSHIWGVQACAQLSCFAIQVNRDDPTRCDWLSVRGLVDLRRLRSDACWTIATTRLINDKGEIQTPDGQHPLDDDDGGDGGDGGSDANPAGLLRRFCSQPLPRFRTVPMGRGYVSVQLDGTSVGNLAAITCMNGFIWPAALPRYRDERNWLARFSAKVRTPVEVLFLDVLVNDEACRDIKPFAEVFGDHRGGDAESPDRHLDRLSIDPPVVRLDQPDPAAPQPLGALDAPEVPRYAEMIEHVFDKVGWDARKFMLHRCRMEYPVMPSSVLMQFELPHGD